MKKEILDKSLIYLLGFISGIWTLVIIVKILVLLGVTVLI